MSQFCISCGNENEDSAKFCRSCGEKLHRKEYEAFDKNDNYATSTANIKTSSENKSLGRRFLKTILAIFVAFIILSISAMIFQVLKMSTSEVSQSIFESFGRVGVFVFALVQLLPVMIGIWLTKVSWKKITN